PESSRRARPETPEPGGPLPRRPDHQPGDHVPALVTLTDDERPTTNDERRTTNADTRSVALARPALPPRRWSFVVGRSSSHAIRPSTGPRQSLMPCWRFAQCEKPMC